MLLVDRGMKKLLSAAFMSIAVLACAVVSAQADPIDPVPPVHPFDPSSLIQSGATDSPTDPLLSPGTPEFFLHHSYVDQNWAK
ncbi:hypothetical protein ACIQVR_27475 [Streptomyces xanthochromogenes]|uniref:hypothetical protein n=1 Tax=Streptomyces xanthochromogenes TaxID=67384 RepID=UPI00380F387D